MVADNIVIHHYENFQSEIPYILFWAEREMCRSESMNSAQSQKFETGQISLFCTDQNITSLWLKFFTLMDHSIIHHYDFFRIV